MNGTIVSYEQQLWQIADALGGSIGAAEYKHVERGLLFLEEPHEKLEAGRAQGVDPEDSDQYSTLNISWEPPEACWWHLIYSIGC